MMDDELELDFTHKALLNGFDEQSLRRLLKLRLNKDLGHITQAENLSAVVLDVLSAAEKEGWLHELITQAKEENPNNYLISILGGEGSMQRYGDSSQDDISEIRIVLFGSKRGLTPGFIETTNAQLEELDRKIGRIEIVINERPTVNSAFFESLLFQIILSVLGLAAVGSLVASVLQAVSNGA